MFGDINLRSPGLNHQNAINNYSGILIPAHGGTGVNNGTFTFTLGGNLSTANSFTTSGNFALTLTTTNTTNVTFPTGTTTLVPTTGTGATGTWPISITGNAAGLSATLSTFACNDMQIYSQGGGL